MRKLYFLLILIYGCSEENHFDFSGSASATKNGIDWTGKVRATQNTVTTDCINLELSVLDKNGMPKESIFMFKIRGVNQQQEITLTNSVSQSDSIGANFTTSNDDVLGDIYEVDSLNNDNYITLTSIDLSKNKIKGRFNIHFRLKRNSGLFGVPPEKIEFSNGYFESTVNPGWIK